MGLHFEKNPDHAENPRSKDECFACHLEGLDTFIPMRHRAQGKEINVESYSALKQDIQKAVRENPDRYVRASRV